MPEGHQPRYLFGDSDLAAERLKVLATVFGGPSRAFLGETVTNRPRLAVDLGCGPGYTTHLLAETLHCQEVVGLDTSPQFLSPARESATHSMRFYEHDVTRIPFPVAPCDLVYCRLLLTHLLEPQATVEAWATQLEPGGLLLIEEVERIETAHSVFRTYLEILDALLAHQGNTLYIGPSLDAWRAPKTLTRRLSRVHSLKVLNRDAASMFLLNMQAWKGHPFVQANYKPALIRHVEEGLGKMAQDGNVARDIEWGIRQVVFERVV